MYRSSGSMEFTNLIVNGLDYAIRAKFTNEHIKGYPGGQLWPEVFLGSMAIEGDATAARERLQTIAEYRKLLQEFGLAWPVNVVPEFEPDNAWNTVLRDLPLEDDCFAFTFDGKQYCLLLGEETDDSELACGEPSGLLSGSGVRVYEKGREK